MGSDARAVLPGFICRLCSHPKKSVIHIFSTKGRRLDLLKKLSYIPISLTRNDRLPKTICSGCIDSLDNQFKLIQQIRKNIMVQQAHRYYHANGRCPIECPLNTSRGQSEATASSTNETNNSENTNSTTSISNSTNSSSNNNIPAPDDPAIT